MQNGSRREVPALARAAAAAAIAAVWAGVAAATPSSTLWTNATTDVQSFRTVHIGVDNYFTVFREFSNGAGGFPTDVGITVGVSPSPEFLVELGIDTVEPSDHPLYFNAKLGTPEGALFGGAPAVNVGIFNVGTQSGSTNQNVVDGLLGKTIPGVGRLF